MRILMRHHPTATPAWRFMLVLLCALSGPAAAEIVDDIGIQVDARGEIDATVRFTVPIQYVRHFPQGKSNYLSIYFNILGSVPRDQWQDYESHRSPPSDLIRGFTVSTRDLATGPKIVVQFNRPATFSVSSGKDDRSIVLHVRPDAVQPGKEPRPVAPPVPVVPLPVRAPVPAPATAPALPAAEPAIAPPAAPPAKPSAAPKAPPSAPLPPLPPLFGSKSGLPVFPLIVPVRPEEAVAPAAKTLTLAEQIELANNQATLFMMQARAAMLAGDLFAAIEAFNKVLNLPPNKYSADAQIWIGIARERSGQRAKAISEYELYLKLYPAGSAAMWTRERLDRLKPLQAAPPPKPDAVPQRTEFQTVTYGSLSMYYFHSASQNHTAASADGTQSASSLSVTDQSTLISNVSMNLRSYNNEFDNRLVFRDFFAANFLPGQDNTNRLNAAYYELKNRIDNYSARVGRQSSLGGGVLGRFDGLSAGYGFLRDWRINAAIGQLSDYTSEAKPRFNSISLDFGLNDPLNGSVYVIDQTVEGITDRRATGGNLTYFEQGMTAMAMLDYDMQFEELNIATLQGTLSGGAVTDYNFLLDRRKTPSLSIRSAVNGTASTIDILRQNGWTQEDLLLLASARTAVSNMAQVGMTRRIEDRWQVGADVVVSNISGMPASGTLIEDGTVGVEGFVNGTPASGNTWSLSGRISGTDVLTKSDVSMASLSYTKSPAASSEMLILNNRSIPRELWLLDTTLRLFLQSGSAGDKTTVVSPVVKVGYQLKDNLVTEVEGGVDWSKYTSSAFPSSRTTRKYFSFGFRLDL